MNKNYLLFQAYGKKEVKYECKFALLHLLKFTFHKQICPVIYTDEPSTFEEILNLFVQHEIIIIDLDLISQWKGSFNFTHRVKIEILKHFLTSHPGIVLYCDTDCYFIRSPEDIYKNIAPGSFYMHTREGYINKKTHYSFKKWERFLMGNPEILGLKQQAEINSLEMWNAGVIGMHSDDILLLDEVLKLTDNIYPSFSKHIVEQFAFSFIFQKKGKILPASAYVFHYWYLKEFASYLELIFSENKDIEFTKLGDKILQLPEKLIQEKTEFEKKTRYIKFLLPKWNIKKTK